MDVLIYEARKWKPLLNLILFFFFQSEEIKQFLESYNKPLRKSKSFDVKDLQAGKSKNILQSSKDQGIVAI